MASIRTRKNNDPQQLGDNMNISDKAVEAAARALVSAQSDHEYHPKGSSGRDDLDRYAESHARAALEAAVPYLAAGLRREAA